MNGVHHLRTLIGISSYPFASLGFKALIIFSTSLVDVYLNQILRYGVSRLLGGVEKSFAVCVLLDRKVVFCKLSATVKK
jgi:hypothetical protein